jgi:hypothetical protein
MRFERWAGAWPVESLSASELAQIVTHIHTERGSELKSGSRHCT